MLLEGLRRGLLDKGCVKARLRGIRERSEASFECLVVQVCLPSLTRFTVVKGAWKRLGRVSAGVILLCGFWV